MSASLDPRVTLTGIFNSGLVNANNSYLFEKLHAPIGFFLSGPTDIAYENVIIYAYASSIVNQGYLYELG
jgi:hypothetical protein